MKTLKPILLMAVFALLMGACQQKRESGEKAGKNSPLLTDTIGESTARRLVKNFDGRTYRVIKKGGPMPDTRCVWFSLKQLKSLVARIDSEGGDGIRFYSAAYDKVKKPDLHKIDTSYLDYATLVMISTRKVPVEKGSKDSIHQDYYYNVKKADGKFKHVGAILTTVPENTGELCPPPATCSKTGATLLP